jgi:HlyD family secretion protein
MSGVCVTNRTKIARWAGSLSAVAEVAAAAMLQAPISRAADPPDDRSWQAVAPGRVEPWSGEIKIAAPVVGRIGEVLVGVNARVFVGEALIRLEDDEARARIATADAQIALRKRARNDQSTSSRAAERRRAEDWVADAERGVFEAQAAVDQTAAARRAVHASEADVAAARVALAREQDRLKQRRSELRNLEDEKNTPLPTQTEARSTSRAPSCCSPRRASRSSRFVHRLTAPCCRSTRGRANWRRRPPPSR